MVRIEFVSPEVVWPVRHEVMYPEMEFESIKLADDAAGAHLGLYRTDKLISVVSVFEDGDRLQFRKFATLDAFQGKGYGTILLEYVINYARGKELLRVWCNARQNASRFYKKFGFRETEKVFYKDGIDFVVMELLLR